MELNFDIKKEGNIYNISSKDTNNSITLENLEAKKIISSYNDGKLFGCFKGKSFYIGGSVVILKKDNESINRSLKIGIEDLKKIINVA